MFQEILAENGTKFVIAAVVVLLGLVCLALVLWIIRGRPSSPFIRGGRNRAPRLAVLDAAAIDTRRRLVLVRRDDMEHLIMIGGPTDIVIETRIASANPETIQPAEKAGPAVERAEPAPARTVETPVRPASVPAAATAAAAMPERRPATAPDGVSAMGKVLYAGDEDTAAARNAPVRTAAQPVATPLQMQPTAQQRMPERRIEDVLEQNRQRVLTPAATAPATAGQPGERPAATPAIAGSAPAVDNPALVSEFEKILEAEIGSNAATAIPVRASTATSTQPMTSPTQTAATLGQPQPGKSREETEAEMARLLGEIAANRKG